MMHAGGGEGDAEGGRRAGQVHGEPGELGDGDEGALRTEAREGLPHRPVQGVLLDARDDFLDAPLLVQAAVHEVPRHLD